MSFDSGEEQRCDFTPSPRRELSMSSSSEIVDSGKSSGQKMVARAPEKSNFSQTCNLLSQYLKEKGTFGDLNLGINTGTATTPTMNLFPVAEKPGQGPVASPLNQMNPGSFFPQQAAGFGSKQEIVPRKAEFSAREQQPESSQMTIFYGGKVIVFNDFPAEKAKEIMLLASKGSSLNTNTFSQKPLEPSKLIPSSAPSFTTNLIQRPPPQPVVADLPIARKASLTRFLEKRKDRITARAPYQATNLAANPPSKPTESKSWLGLAAAQSPLQFETQL